jgi:hypothetical protein
MSFSSRTARNCSAEGIPAMITHRRGFVKETAAEELTIVPACLYDRGLSVG